MRQSLNMHSFVFPSYDIWSEPVDIAHSFEWLGWNNQGCFLLYQILLVLIYETCNLWHNLHLVEGDQCLVEVEWIGYENLLRNVILNKKIVKNVYKCHITTRLWQYCSLYEYLLHFSCESHHVWCPCPLDIILKLKGYRRIMV